LFIIFTSKIPSSQTKAPSLCWCKVSFFMLFVVTNHIWL
jgi:hypothetical protein